MTKPEDYDLDPEFQKSCFDDEELKNKENKNGRTNNN